MIKVKDLTVKNFMSVGNQTQAVDFNKEQLTLVLGENLDQGGDDSGSRNGTGKTTIINALSYALYGQALTNIKRNNLINKTNSKGMLVTLHFEKDGQGRSSEFIVSGSCFFARDTFTFFGAESVRVTPVSGILVVVIFVAILNLNRVLFASFLFGNYLFSLLSFHFNFFFLLLIRGIPP